MKVLLKIFITLLALFLFIFIGGYIFFAVQGKSIVTDAVQKELNRKATVEKVSLSFPIAINIKNLNIQDLADIDYLSISPSLLGFFSGKIVLNNVTLLRPNITLKKLQDGSFNIPQPQKGKQEPPIIVSLNIKDGKVNFIDYKIDPQGFKILVENINADVHKRAFPLYPVKVDFNLSADIPAKDVVAKASLAGWLDITHKDMDAKFNIKDIDAVHYQPYFKNFAQAKLKSATIDFTSDIKANNNDLKSDCRLESRNIAFAQEPKPQETAPQAQPPQGETSEVVKPEITSRAENLIFGIPLDLFKNPEGKFVIDFWIAGKLMPFKISRFSLKMMPVENAVQNILHNPKALENIMTKDPQELKDMGKDFKAIGKQLKNMFKSKPQEETTNTTGNTTK